MAEYKTPGVYIEEISKLPPSIASVETAIPAFIGYTEKATWKKDDDLLNIPWRIKSMLEYEQYFGKPEPEKKDSLTVTFSNGKVNAEISEALRSNFLMHYSMQMFFANGGGPCWIVAVDKYQEGGVQLGKLQLGLAEVAKVNEVTLLLFPDAINFSHDAGGADNYYQIHIDAIKQCADLQDRFVLLDVFHIDENEKIWEKDVAELREKIGAGENLKYAASYFPKLHTGIDFYYKDPRTSEDNDENIKIVGVPGKETLLSLKSGKNAEYFQAKTALSNLPMLLPASSAMAGIYAQTDNSRGVWKAPANINISNVIEPEFLLSKVDQDGLNVDANDGKSINAIRKFEGRGAAIVWGARTLNGNSNEWRYIPVRRFFIMVEESVKNATQRFVFEPNDENTWIRVKSMIQNYLTTQWRAGALMGASVKEAYFVHVGLGETMTELDVWEGRMIIEIGMAVVRPAEFIILRFMHKMLQES
jgi:phage tail sheath protein FI